MKTSIATIHRTARGAPNDWAADPRCHIRDLPKEATWGADPSELAHLVLRVYALDRLIGVRIKRVHTEVRHVLDAIATECQRRTAFGRTFITDERILGRFLPYRIGSSSTSANADP
jgi:hypothetical protein